MRFVDYTGEYVYHCHILAHEDRGMMGTVVVEGPGDR
jgi:FtsP/CotA-like multicopper oxidase with cupredoxin domain